MKKFIQATAILFLCLFASTAPAQAADPEPRFFSPAQEVRVKAIEAEVATIKALKVRVAALESLLALPEPPPMAMPGKLPAYPAPVAAAQPALSATGAVIDAAPAGKVWVKAGTVESDAPWTLQDATSYPAAVTSFPTPIRTAVSRLTTGSPCANGRCPR